MKIRKFNENSVSSMTPENVYCLYDDNEHRIIELFLNESESKSKAVELNTQFNTDLYNKVTSKPDNPFSFNRYKSLLLSKAIEELHDYWSDLYTEHDESF